MTTYLKNMKNKTWKKVKNILNIPIPGPIVAGCLTGALLGTTTALFTLLPVRSPRENISVESISGKNESLDLQIKLKSGEELRLKATGVTTMDLVQSLKRMLQSMDGTLLLEKSYPSTKL